MLTRLSLIAVARAAAIRLGAPRNRAGAVEEVADFLFEEDGEFVFAPSVSPENGHPKGTSVCAGPTMDQQIIRDLFTNCIQASKILGVDEGEGPTLARPEEGPEERGVVDLEDAGVGQVELEGRDALVADEARDRDVLAGDHDRRRHAAGDRTR